MIPRSRFTRASERPSGIITLLTDFGTDDPSVGMMEGVILASFPEARVVALSHAVPPQNVLHGAFWLAHSYEWFPDGSVHLAIVDPGLQGLGRPIAIRAGRHYFVGPDNGLLSAALERAAFADSHDPEIREIDPSCFELGTALPPRTLHGRDVFAPVAADLASGRMVFSRIGKRVDFVTNSPVPKPQASAARIDGEIVCVDHFGNLITNIRQELLLGMREKFLWLEERAIPIADSYFDVEPGAYVALVNSLGTLEIARRESDARSSLGASPGTKVRVQ